MPSRIKQQLFAAPLAREIAARLRAPPRSEDGRSADGDAATAVSDDERAALALLLSTAFRRLPSKRSIIEVSVSAAARHFASQLRFTAFDFHVCSVPVAVAHGLSTFVFL